MVLDANTGAVLHDAAGSDLRHPASLTKMMTLYLVFERIERARLTYESKLKVSQEAASAPPSKLDLDPGEEITLIDAIKAVITKSANDVAIALAEHVAGSEARFVQLMNERARQIGMKDTVFRNASGLPHPEQVTTARDMITLALRLQDDFPRHYSLFQTRTFSYEGSTYRNHNTLLFNTPGTDGIKTGYTRMSGFNLVASIRRDGKHVIGAVFGGASASSRDAHVRSLLTRALLRASASKTRRPAPILIALAKPAPALVPAPVPALRPRPEQRPAVVAAKPSHSPERATAAPPTSPPPPPAPVEVARGRLASAAVPAPIAIETVRVRPVMVPPRPQAPAVPQHAVVSEPAARPPTPFQQAPLPAPIPALRSPVREVAPSALPAAPPTPFEVASAGRGAAPSTLQAQAQRLALGGPGKGSVLQQASTARGAQAAPPHGSSAAPAGASMQIQVGAYPTSQEAQRQLASVRERAASLLGGRSPLIMPVQKDKRQLYRARFTGFEPQSAAAACHELRRLAVDCFVMRAE